MPERVQLLLKSHGNAGDFLEPIAVAAGAKSTIVVTAPPPSEKPGDQIGHYKIREQLGEGGCGIVYVAEQTEPVRRRVALKVIKLTLSCSQKQFYMTMTTKTTATSKPNVYLFTRWSSAKQTEGDSKNRQHSNGEAWCAQRDLPMPEVIGDKAVVVILNETSISAAFCPAYAVAEFFQFQVRGLPADNLTLQIDPLHTATSAIANSSCALTTVFNFGGVGCSGSGLVFYFNHLGNGVTTLPLYWKDGLIDMPPSVLNI